MHSYLKIVGAEGPGQGGGQMQPIVVKSMFFTLQTELILGFCMGPLALRETLAARAQ